VLLAGAAPARTAPPVAPAAQPEFGGQCALGLAEGHSIATDCSISWTAKDGKRYCFSSEQARKQFLEDPQGNIQRALDFSAAGAVQATGERMDAYKTEDVESFVSHAIAETVAHNNGVFPLVDPVTGTTLRLIYEKIDFTRTLHGYGFFPDVIFHAQEDAGKRYLVDFWVKPGADKLEIVVAPGNPKRVTGLRDLARRDLLVVLEDPSVPAGSYSRLALTRAGVKVSPKSLELDVKAALGKVTSGEADASIVYASDVLAAGSRASGVQIPDDQNVIATYPIAVVRGTDNHAGAVAFVDDIVSGSGRQALTSHGFLPA